MECLYGIGFPVHLKFMNDESFEDCNCIILKIRLMPFIMSYASREFVISLINLHLLILVINNDQECKWNPTLAISDLGHINPNIRTFIYFKSIERQGLIYAV